MLQCCQSPSSVSLSMPPALHRPPPPADRASSCHDGLRHHRSHLLAPRRPRLLLVAECADEA
uniref:Uncharacterized protein n=1 Tax=Oryza sativa subsp. japonica TaxID=39947 RepID=Q6ZL09_ORYSJ|nr:hypothetical protein [Oryza sativa Japonica Group]BAD30230.1 hypothetical protein [Oryza sativa Japonica Group]